MINTSMRYYDYFTYGEKDAYGQVQLSESAQGTIKMSINILSQSTQDHIKYKDCSYVGITHFNIDDSYVIQYGNERLKVLYVNPQGRFKQVFMREI